MKKKIIPKIALAVLEEEANTTGYARPSVGYGDLSLLDKISMIAGLVGHPIENHAKILNALDRSPENFNKRKIHAHDSRGKKRLVRNFEPRWDLNDTHLVVRHH